MKTQIDILKEIEKFSFGDKGTLRFYHQKFQDGYLQAIKDIISILSQDGPQQIDTTGTMELRIENSEWSCTSCGKPLAANGVCSCG